MPRSDKRTIMSYLIVLAVIGLVYMTGLVSCTDTSGAMRTLQSQGYTDIVITGYRYFGCGDESVHTGFSAKGPTGVPISGVVCSGATNLFGKSHTIRLD